MRTIVRNPNPPDCLAQQPAGQDWYAFMQTPCHAEVSDSLHGEQHHLCCYCESEISDGDSHMEHMEPRSVNQGRVYDYTNLAASCNGGAIEHCGHYKDNRHKKPLYPFDATRFREPHNENTCALFQYLLNGDIAVSDGLANPDDTDADYMIKHLGLDCPRLVGRRKAHARSLNKTLGSNPDPALIQWALQYYLQPDTDGHLRQFFSLSNAILNP
jgi:uncharacterized protein (TIGR02646 family)